MVGAIIIKTREYIKQNKGLLIRACALGILPLLLCIIYCALHNKTIFDVYLPSSEWNDELFYFKQVEGIIKYGFPQGYFGFNESHAQFLSFAAWSPVLIFPWVIWGKIFGWGFLSPIFCNIFLMTIATVIFVMLVKPNLKQTILIGISMTFFTPFVRYMLSGMPEVICYSMGIIFYGLAYSYKEKDDKYKLIILMIMSAVMTLMRPYLILFMALPIYFCIRKYKVKGLIFSTLSGIVTVIAYACIKKFFGAEYFADLFFTDWITTFFTEGFSSGLHNFASKLYYMCYDFKNHTVKGITQGLCSGAIFASYLCIMLVMFVQTVVDTVSFIKKKNREEIGKTLELEIHYFISLVCMLIALLLMYKLTEGSKHLLLFLALGVFLFGILRTKYFEKVVILGAVYLFFFTIMARDPYDYAVPFYNEDRSAALDEWSEVFEERLTVNSGDVPNFDNVVIWTFYDEVEDNNVSSVWQYLYKLPKGFGISCAMPEYVITNIDKLSSKYIFVPSDGTIDKMLTERASLVHSDGEVSLYELR